MSKAHLEARIQQWLETNHEIIHNPPLRANRCSIDFEKARQRGILDELNKIGSKDLSRQIKDQCALNVGKVPDNIVFLDYIAKIAGFEGLFSYVTTEVLSNAHHLSTEEMDSLTEVRKPLLGTVQRCWQWAEQLAGLTRLHMRNAAEYNAFHVECHDANERLMRNFSHALRQLECLFHLSPSERTKRLLTNLTDSLKHCLSDWEAVDRLLVRSHSVVPVAERLGLQRSPSLRAVCACAYETPEFRVIEGEEVLILDNNDKHLWRVALNDGSEVLVPSIIVWIPPCDLPSVDKAAGLRRKFSDLWTSMLDKFRTNTIAHLNSVFKNFLDRQALIEVSSLVAAQELFDLIEHTILSDEPTEPVQSLAHLLAEVKARTAHKEQVSACGRDPALRPDAVHFPTTELVRLHTIISKLWQHLHSWKQFQEGPLAHRGLGCRHHDSALTDKLAATAVEDIEHKLAQNRDELQRLQRSLDAWSGPSPGQSDDRHDLSQSSLAGRLDMGGGATAAPTAGAGRDVSTDTGSLTQLLLQLLEERRELARAALRRGNRQQETQTQTQAAASDLEASADGAATEAVGEVGRRAVVIYIT